MAALDENKELRERISTLEATNSRLVHEAINLQNPAPKNVARINGRRG
ncbi:hypothetical protein [Mycobacteroides franklinii]|nr:hypothetical protein [Mycobacteroides franklinii]